MRTAPSATASRAPGPQLRAARVPDRVGVGPEGAAGRLRLTRRGRVVVWLLALSLAAGVGGAAASAQADGPAAGTEVRRVLVAPGDTLWGIAADAAAPGEDVRDVVLELMALNELSSGGLQAGQTVVVPAG
ncbi:LysM peptidoglycan-binding domain-containing protein [Cellulomonas phragmiteti]|uniref:LysM peptidoglycan-binding domain-containing protein n=1 Tax=Cellulomonas phragmiteti TaxID=478780 RepID=UPI001EF25DF2|nr:LysM peptidoglycan-binding domain-containing protein [Cellulomonas phragmiteti]